MDIKEQTQELLNKLLMGKIVKHDEVKDLLRQVVEECIIKSCGNCKRGFPVKYIVATEEYRHSYCYCEASDIRSYFAWLRRGEQDNE